MSADPFPGGLEPLRLAVARAAAGVTQVALAQRIGVSQAALSRWETGMRAPQPDVLERWRAELDGVIADGTGRGRARQGRGRRNGLTAG